MNEVIERIADDLRALGVRKQGMLLVHASLRSLGPVKDGPETVIQSLLTALGGEGTLLLPTLSYQTVNTATPYFDVGATPSCVGTLTEHFRQRKGTYRSIHPTHSVCAVGALAEAMLRDHHHDATPCGSNSPFYKLPHHDGQILFLGCGMRPNTSMHAIEELSEPPYLFGPIVEYAIRDADGNTSKMRVRSHDFKGWAQRYDRLEHLLSEDDLHTGKVLDADCQLVDAAAMWSVAHERIESDPLFFVELVDDQTA